MENNTKSTKIVWIVVAVVVIIGLALIAQKSGKEASLEVATEKLPETANVSTTTTSEVKPTAAKPAIKPVTLSKPQANVVRYTSKGFVPFVLEIKKGESVEFLNESDKAMVIRSHDNKPENFYPGFSQESGPLGKGGKFYFAFTRTGAWSYYNLNGNKEEGVIIVK